jgi:hypothetical protein
VPTKGALQLGHTGAIAAVRNINRQRGPAHSVSRDQPHAVNAEACGLDGLKQFVGAALFRLKLDPEIADHGSFLLLS